MAKPKKLQIVADNDPGQPMPRWAAAMRRSSNEPGSDIAALLSLPGFWIDAAWTRREIARQIRDSHEAAQDPAFGREADRMDRVANEYEARFVQAVGPT